MYQNLSIYYTFTLHQKVSKSLQLSTMLPGVFVNVRYKCEYVHLFLHMTALHTVTYAQHFFQYFQILACATAYRTICNPLLSSAIY